jgi:hypothetical protein
VSDCVVILASPAAGADYSTTQIDIDHTGGRSDPTIEILVKII